MDELLKIVLDDKSEQSKLLKELCTTETYFPLMIKDLSMGNYEVSHYCTSSSSNSRGIQKAENTFFLERIERHDLD